MQGECTCIGRYLKKKQLSGVTSHGLQWENKPTSYKLERSIAKQDGVPHAHALLVWGKCSRRLSGLHTGFTDFSFFRYFSHGST